MITEIANTLEANTDTEGIAIAKNRENIVPRESPDHVLVQGHVIEGGQGQGHQEGHGLAIETDRGRGRALEIIVIEKIGRNIQDDHGRIHQGQDRVLGRGQDQGHAQGHVQGRVQGHLGHPQAQLQGN